MDQSIGLYVWLACSTLKFLNIDKYFGYFGHFIIFFFILCLLLLNSLTNLWIPTSSKQVGSMKWRLETQYPDVVLIVWWSDLRTFSDESVPSTVWWSCKFHWTRNRQLKLWFYFANCSHWRFGKNNVHIPVIIKIWLSLLILFR